MQRIMRFYPILFQTLFLLALGCEMPLVVEEPVEEASPEAMALATQVEGAWRIEGILTNTCPTPSSGMATSSISNGLFCSVRIAAFVIRAI